MTSWCGELVSKAVGTVEERNDPRASLVTTRAKRIGAGRQSSRQRYARSLVRLTGLAEM